MERWERRAADIATFLDLDALAVERTEQPFDGVAVTQQNPIAGAAAAAKITGTTALLKPDAKALGNGTVTGLTTATTLDTLGLTTGQTISVVAGATTPSFTVGATPATQTVQDVLTALGSAGMTANVVSGKIQLKSANFQDSIAVTGTGAHAATTRSMIWPIRSGNRSR